MRCAKALQRRKRDLDTPVHGIGRRHRLEGVEGGQQFPAIASKTSKL